MAVYNPPAQVRLERIAAAHCTSNDLGNLICEECLDPYPCPTYIWATSIDLQHDPFDLRDKASEGDAR